MAFDQISDSFGAALLECVRRDRQRAMGGANPHRNLPVPRRVSDLHYGLVQADWQENGVRPALPSVNVLECDSAGIPDDGTLIAVRLLRAGDMDPAVYAADTGSAYGTYPGDVIAWTWDVDGNPVALDSYLAPKMGTVVMWLGDAADIPYGWHLLDGSTVGATTLVDARGLFPQCYDTRTPPLWANGDTMGSTGTTNGINQSTEAAASGSGVSPLNQIESSPDWAAGGVGNASVIRPPRFVIGFIQRVK